MAVLHLKIVAVAGDRVDFADKDGRRVWAQLLPGEAEKWKVGDEISVGSGLGG